VNAASALVWISNQGTPNVKIRVLLQSLPHAPLSQTQRCPSESTHQQHHCRRLGYGLDRYALDCRTKGVNRLVQINAGTASDRPPRQKHRHGSLPCQIQRSDNEGEEKISVKVNGAVILKALALKSSGGIVKLKAPKFKASWLMTPAEKFTPFIVTVPLTSLPELVQPKPAVVQPLVIPAVDSLQTLRPKSPGLARMLVAEKVVVAFEPLKTVALPLSRIGSAWADTNGSKLMAVTPKLHDWYLINDRTS